MIDVGVNYHPAWDTEAPAIVEKMSAAHMRWMRLDVCWCAMADPGYRLRVQRSVADVHAHGMKALAVFWGTPGVGRFNAAPDPQRYALAAKDAVQTIPADAWEIWNEPNSRTFYTGTATQYGHLLAAAYEALHPLTTVVFGGTAHTDTRFVKEAIRAGARFDVLAVHPYPNKTGTPASSFRGLPALHRLTRKPIWITETGWSSRSVGEARQASYLVAAVKMIPRLYPYVRKLFIYGARDDEGGGWLGGLGLLRRDMTEKPVYAALQSFLGR